MNNYYFSYELPYAIVAKNEAEARVKLQEILSSGELANNQENQYHLDFISTPDSDVYITESKIK